MSKIVIEVWGGAVANVRSDNPNIEVEIVDWDVLVVEHKDFPRYVKKKVIVKGEEGIYEINEKKYPHDLTYFIPTGDPGVIE